MQCKMNDNKSTTISADYLRLAIAVSSSSASLPLAAVKRDDVCITDCVPSETISFNAACLLQITRLQK